MALQLKFRLHEWLADHVRWVQYPRQQYISAKQAAPRPKRPFWRYQMPWWQRLSLFYFSLLALIVSSALLVVGLVFGYFLLRAIFTT